MKILLTIMLLIFSATPAFAGWVKLGVAVQCETKQKIFAVVPVVETSSEEHNISAPNGFTKLGEGQYQLYECDLDEANIKMRINVYGPQPRGMGQGAGVIIIDSLEINDYQLIKEPTNFNWQVITEKVLTEIRVEKQAEELNVELCHSSGWNWSAPYQNKQCE